MIRRSILLTLALTLSASTLLHAQVDPGPAPATPAVNTTVTPVATPRENLDRAWTLLSTTVADTKHVEPAIQALAALGTMASNERAANLIKVALKDPEQDIRTAAILAAGQTKNPALRAPLHAALDDAEPAVAFTVAVTLWRMHDHAGQDILLAIATGERRAGPTMYNGTRHSLTRDLHNPATLAKLGAMQGATMLLGPFGYGLTAAEYARKNGGESGRSTAISLLAEQHTAAMHAELLSALSDKEPAARAAAANALGSWPDAATAAALVPLLDDSKLPVRLTAAAAYIRASGSRSTHTPRKQ